MATDNFLDELTGGLVRFLRADATIRSHVGGVDANDQDARIFFESARHGAGRPYVVYTQSAGSSEIDHAGPDGCENMTLHVYSHADSPNAARALAVRVRDLMLAAGVGADTNLADGTKIKVCNGGIVDSGFEFAKDGSDTKRFWVRNVLRLLIE